MSCVAVIAPAQGDNPKNGNPLGYFGNRRVSYREASRRNLFDQEQRQNYYAAHWWSYRSHIREIIPFIFSKLGL
jgi:hypothetical protein